MGVGANGRLTSALLPIGTVALVAGCSGGSVHSSGAYIPPGASSANRAPATVQISVSFSSSSSALLRKTQTINTATTQLGVRIVPSPAPAVTPTEATFTLPSGPVPTSTTLTVTGSSGPDTLIVSAYGVAANVTLAPLDMAVQNATLSANGTNAISLTLNPAAYGAQLQMVGTANPNQWSPLENFALPQTATMSVAPYDAFGNPITGSTGNAVVVTGPAGSSFPQATAAGNITATYAAGSNAGGSMTSGGTFLPSGAHLSVLPASSSLPLVPDYYIFAVDKSSGTLLDVFDAASASQLGSAVTLSRGRVPQGPLRGTQSVRSSQATRQPQVASVNSKIAAANVSACTSGQYAAAAAIVNDLGITVVTVSPSGVVSSPISISTSGFLGLPGAVAFDGSCNLYVGDTNGDLGVASLSGVISTPIEQPILGGDSIFGVNGLAATSSAMYIGYRDGSTTSYYVGTFPLGSAGTITPLGSFAALSPYYNYTFDALALAGGTVYAAYTTDTSSCYNDFQAVTGGSPATRSFSSEVQGSAIQFVGTTAGTLFAATNDGYLVSIAGGTATASTPGGNAPNGIAVSQDSPTSTLWYSSTTSGGYLYSLTVAALTQTASIHISGITPGVIAIAP
jgi:hypothetical protein